MRTIHKEAHLIERIGWLRAAVLGANDGLIWTSSLIVGVAAATTAQHEILVAGIAGLVAGPWGIRTSSLWYAIVGNTAPAGSYAAARKSNLRWLRAPATKSSKQQKPRRITRRGFLLCTHARIGRASRGRRCECAPSSPSLASLSGALAPLSRFDALSIAPQKILRLFRPTERPAPRSPRRESSAGLARPACLRPGIQPIQRFGGGERGPS